MNGDGGVYIKQLIDNGALVEDFTIELLGIYPLEECLEKEAELAKTSLYPKGLNGNAGSHIEMTETVREKLSKAANKRVKNGTHNLLGGEISKQSNLKRVKNKTHHFLGIKNPTYKRLEDGTHNFLGPNINNKRVENGTHPFLGGEIQRKIATKRLKDGTHNLQVKGMMTALNIETGEVHRISRELYHSRRDIYFHPTSNVFKQWKTR